jgi:hypothetical protein
MRAPLWVKLRCSQAIVVFFRSPTRDIEKTRAQWAWTGNKVRAGGSHAMTCSVMYHKRNRRLQDQFDTRRISDRLEEKLTQTDAASSVLLV